MPFGLFIFIFFQSIILSIRFSLAFSRSERVSEELLLANKKLSGLDELKDNFLANTSHELKTPLNGIIGIVEVLINDKKIENNSNLKQELNLIFLTAKRLSRLVNDLLDYQKLKENDLKLQFTSVDINSSIRIVMELSRFYINQKSIRLVNQIPKDIPFVKADENRLQQILINLIYNAIKYTTEGDIIITARVVWQKERKMIEISVTDSGIGIAASDWNRY